MTPTPTPKTLYIHDDLSDDVAAQHGADSDAARAVRSLLALVGRDVTRTRILKLEEQLAALVDGHHAPFSLAVGIGRAGERVEDDDGEPTRLGSLTPLPTRARRLARAHSLSRTGNGCPPARGSPR